MRVQGRQTYTGNRSDCADGDVTIDKTFYVPGLSRYGIPGSFEITSSEFMSITVGGQLPGPAIDGMNAPGVDNRLVEIRIAYIGENRSGGSSTLTTLMRQTLQ